MKKFLFKFYVLFLVVTALLSAESFEVSTITLTWEHDPITTMTVQWLTKENDNNTPIVRYKAKDSQQWNVEQGLKISFPSSQLYINRVELNDLTPNMQYVFRINKETQEFIFQTMPSVASQPISFVVGGDMYHDSLEIMNKTSDEAAKTNPAFAIIGGDIAYVYGKTIHINRWVEWIQSWHTHMVTPDKRMIPVVATIGNHDIQGQFDQSPLQASPFATLFPMPGKKIYNILDFNGYMSLFLLDSGHANPIGGAQADWLKAALDQRQRVPYKFAIYHVPAYPSVRSITDKRSTQIRQSWLPLFEAGGIRVAFEHHDHAYKRTFPLWQNKVNPNGIIFLGDGGWGADVPRRRSKGVLPYYLAKFESTRNFILVTLKEKQQLFQAIDDNGIVFDEVKLISE